MGKLQLIENDPYLAAFEDVLNRRHDKILSKKQEILKDSTNLAEFANGHNYFGCQKTKDSWIFREWAPNATSIRLAGDKMGWENPVSGYSFTNIQNGVWELILPLDKLCHSDEYKLLICWPGGEGYRLSPWSLRVVQDSESKLFTEQIWDPEYQYTWKFKSPDFSDMKPLLIYEAHVGMSSEKEEVSNFNVFADKILPRIAKSGYNTIQLMAIQEHPYYGSFGYHVSNLFAVSSRFGTPEDLKLLIDTAHELGLKVIMDLVHSHAVKNILEGPGLFDGIPGMFFHSDHRREHPAWDSFCYDYGRNETLHFLLSNCKFWLDEYHFDGFRFDGITSMLYFDHGLEKSFDSYEQYFDQGVDEDATTYLGLCNILIKELNKNAISIAEDMSGMPGLAAQIADGGLGFDFRLAMGIPDFWIRLIKEKTDEEWNVSEIFHELTNHRKDEQVISYAESHDQAMVGDKTIIFRLADKEMYTHMSIQTPNLVVDRALALHKMIRLVTLGTNGGGYLNFMGNEFGHPEWIDFPREGNNWSYQYARRQWNLADNPNLKYQYLNKFDQELLRIFNLAEDIKPNEPELLLSNENDQVLAFKRGNYILIFNFNPSKSFTDYGIPGYPADYQIILSTDKEEYGGFKQINTEILLESVPITDKSSNYQIMTYLPSRTAMILKMIPTPGIR